MLYNGATCICLRILASIPILPFSPWNPELAYYSRPGIILILEKSRGIFKDQEIIKEYKVSIYVLYNNNISSIYGNTIYKELFL